MWLKNTSVVSADGGTFRIGVPSKLAKDWLEDRFAGLIPETLQAGTGSEVEVDFVVSANDHRSAGDGEEVLLVAREADDPAPAVAPSELNEKFKFSNFV